MLRLSKRPAPQLSGSCSVCFVNNGVVSIAYQFEPDGRPENISEEDRAEPVQARLLQHVSEGSRFKVLYYLSHTQSYRV